MTRPVIVWFRQDLRLADNPALASAAATGAPILPVYILDDENAGDSAIAAASRWWLHQSLESLSRSLGGHLSLFRGDAGSVITELVAATGARGVFWNRCYEPWQVARDRRIEDALTGGGISVEIGRGSLLFEPESILKDDGAPYRVYTPFYRRCRISGGPRGPASVPELTALRRASGGVDLGALGLIPGSRWHQRLGEVWQPGEEGARQRLDRFLAAGISGYRHGRDFPAAENVSRLSPHLHFGEISPHEVWHAATACLRDAGLEADVEHFLRELCWREFSYYLLTHFPDLPRENFQAKFDRFPWRNDDEALARWQSGKTGIPIVDAGMRELWQTGYMHNRVRMLAASFLVKNLLIDWRDGADWFMDTLVDADLANNSASWQWVAGSGADAAPYFRIFNPVTQARKFDAEGEYVRRFVPELAALPNRWLHSPWEAPASILKDSGVELGESYPTPIVDLKASRQHALEAFRSLR